MKSLITFIAVIVTFLVQAQEFKLSKSSGTLDIREVGKVRLEGYAGNEIVFSSRSYNGDRDERAKGLRAISSMGLEDNTGIGLSVVENGDVVEVRQLKKMDGPDIMVKVPKGIKVIYTHTSPHGDELEVRDLENELDVSTVHNDIHLENAKGVLKIRSVHGDIDASFNSINNAVSISSTHGHVDVSLPVTAKADLKLSTTWGEIFVDPALKLELDKTGDMVKYSDRINAKLNGGGMDINLSSTHENVYLRKK